MRKIAVVHEEQSAVQSRLAELGIPDQELLREAVAEGEVARAAFAKNVPAMAVGCATWGVTVGGLRNRLVPHRWIVSRRGLEETLNPTARIAIVVSTGDEATGGNAGEPRTKYQKGAATREAVEQNNAQLSLLSMLHPSHPDYMPDFKPDIAPARALTEGGAGPDGDGVMTWVLLVFRADDEVRCELSLPSGFGIDSVVESWSERILLKPIPLDSSPKVEGVPVEPTPEIDVQVTRRKQS